MSDVLKSQQADQAALGEMKSRHGRVMCRLAEMAEAGAERAHARVMSADDGPEFDAAIVTFDRVARCLRLSMALEARLFREHRSDRRDEVIHTVRARIGLGEGLTPSRASGLTWNERENDAPEGSMDRMVRGLGIDPGLSPDDQAQQIREHIEQKLAAAEAGLPEAPERLEFEPEPESEPPAPDPHPPAEFRNGAPDPEPTGSLDILLARLDAPDSNRSEAHRNPPNRYPPERPFAYRDYS